MDKDKADYAAFEERVRRTVYVDSLSPVATESVLKTGFGQFGTVKSVRFIPNYSENRNMAMCALVEMENERQARAVVSDTAQYPFMISGAPRPARALPAEMEMFEDRPPKPGRKMHCRWLDENDPDLTITNKIKRLVKKQAAEASFLLKLQLEKEEELAKQQGETLRANYKKYEAIDVVMADGTAQRLAQRFGVKYRDD